MNSLIHILVFEDDSGDRELLKRHLEKNPCIQITFLSSLEEGLKRLQKGNIHLILLDLTLPDSRGLETFRKLRPHSLNVPIIILSGFDDEETALSAVREGAQDYLTKGDLTPKMLQRAIHHAIERHQLTQLLNASMEKERFLAYHDPLTQLPNRHAFYENLERAIHQARRNKQALSVIFLDLDHFKPVNDALGHRAGDQLLEKISALVKSQLRKSDLLARIGGDEFTVLLTELSHPDDVHKVGQKILGVFSLPFELSGKDFRVTASLGASLFPKDGADAETLIKKADAAMYLAKQKGRNQIQFWEEPHHPIIDFPK